MTTIKATFLTMLLAAGVGAVTSSGRETDDFRTDINPALRYYQAFILTPELTPAERDYLFDRDWRGQKLPEKLGELVGRYDSQFRIVREAVHATVPCDWGIDMTPGPATLLPHLARNKAIQQMARLRAMWDLQQGKQAEARDDLLAAFELSRHCAGDGTLISMLVQIAGENIVCSAIAENFHQFSPQTLQQLAEGLEAAPPRTTAADCIQTEKAFFIGWLERKIVAAQTANPGNDGAVMAGIHELVTSMEGPPEGQTNAPQQNTWERLNRAAGGTSDGVLRLLHETTALYDRFAVILELPLSQYEEAAQQFSAEIEGSKNPLASLGFPAVLKCRQKEFAILEELAMVRAAIEFKLRGEEGFKSVNDPCGQGPFEFERFVFGGIDRGFEIKSAYAGRGYQEALIFVEKDGVPFHINGPKIGQPVAKTSGKP